MLRRWNNGWKSTLNTCRVHSKTTSITRTKLVACKRFSSRSRRWTRLTRPSLCLTSSVVCTKSFSVKRSATRWWTDDSWRTTISSSRSWPHYSCCGRSYSLIYRIRPPNVEPLIVDERTQTRIAPTLQDTRSTPNVNSFMLYFMAGFVSMIVSS